jgi:hypothetical protein
MTDIELKKIIEKGRNWFEENSQIDLKTDG